MHNLQKLVSWMQENLTDDDVDFSTVTKIPKDKRRHPRPEFDSVCCPLGWSPTVFNLGDEWKRPNTGRWKYDDIRQQLLNVVDDDFNYLFGARHSNSIDEFAERVSKYLNSDGRQLRISRYAL